MSQEKLFFGCVSLRDTIYVSNWSRSILPNLMFVNTFFELLQCHKKIILVDSIEAVRHIEVVQKLISQKNYLIFLRICEAEENNICKIIPQAQVFPWILGGENKNIFSVNVDGPLFVTTTEQSYMVGSEYTIEQSFSKLKKPYDFLYLNGANRPYRLNLWHLLENNKLLSNSLCSFLDDPVNKSLPGEYESVYAETAQFETHKNNVKNYREFNRKYFKNQWVGGEIIPQQYIDTYFSVVSETLVDNDINFVTEKTYKPLLAGHPFIVLSNPGHLAYLHKLGFKTFSPWIDESYDLEIDLNKRTTMVVEQIAKLNGTDLDTFLQNVKAICVHNQQHFMLLKWQHYITCHRRLTEFFMEVQQRAQIYFEEPKKE